MYIHDGEKELYERESAFIDNVTGQISNGQADLSELGQNADELHWTVEHITTLFRRMYANAGNVSRYWF